METTSAGICDENSDPAIERMRGKLQGEICCQFVLSAIGVKRRGIDACYEKVQASAARASRRGAAAMELVLNIKLRRVTGCGDIRTVILDALERYHAEYNLHEWPAVLDTHRAEACGSR
jgi:hypothetical protein